MKHNLAVLYVAGSYIFSQTIFSMRAGVASYLHGVIIFVVEASIFLLPISGARTHETSHASPHARPVRAPLLLALTLACPLLPAVVQYLPTFFFGALLTVFGIEIAGDWLVGCSTSGGCRLTTEGGGEVMLQHPRHAARLPCLMCPRRHGDVLVWLQVRSYAKVTQAEYVLLLATFLAIMQVNQLPSSPCAGAATVG